MKNRDLRSLSPDERPREKALLHGLHTLSNRELFALILRSGTRHLDVLDISSAILDKFANLRDLAIASVGELEKVPGIGTTKALQVKACIEIARRFCQKPVENGQVLLNSKQVYQHFQSILRDEKKEKFYLLHLNSKNQLLKQELISIGSLNASIVHPREVFSSAIKESSNSILLIHNHPSGDPTPSDEDIRTTRRLIKVGVLVGIKVIDHIIIGDGCYVSLAEQNIVCFQFFFVIISRSVSDVSSNTDKNIPISFGRIILKEFICIFLCMIFSFCWAQTSIPKDLTAEEKQQIIDQFASEGDSWEIIWGKYLQSKKNFRFSPPKGKFIAPAEFEKCEGVCISWTGYNRLLTNIAKEVSVTDKVYIVTNSPEYVTSILEQNGCNMANIVFIRQRLNSVWMRDYGPWFIYTDSGKRGIIDLVYNRPRPLDDKFPKSLGDKFGWETFQCPLILPGGNLILDGHKTAIMTDVVFDPKQGGDPNLSEEQLKRYMKDYFSCDQVYIVPDMENDGTGHIDMFCKLLDDKNIILGEYETPMDGYGNNYYILNDIAEKLSQMKNSKGQNFIVHRIPMPAYKWGVSYTHTNSLIVNNTILVPIYGRGTDERALNVYRKLMPNHRVVGIDCNEIIGANGAIHCITKLVMAKKQLQK